MAEYQKIEYRIGPNGKVTETVINGQGESCTLATEALEKSLGQIESRELLPEYDGGQDNVLIQDLTVEQSQSIQQKD